MNRCLAAALVLTALLAASANFATTRAQDKKEGLRALVGTEVRAVLGRDTVNSAEVNLTLDSVEAEGIWASKIVLLAGPKDWPKDMADYTYFFPWSSVSSIRVKKEKK